MLTSLAMCATLLARCGADLVVCTGTSPRLLKGNNDNGVFSNEGAICCDKTRSVITLFLPYSAWRMQSTPSSALSAARCTCSAPYYVCLTSPCLIMRSAGDWKAAGTRAISKEVDISVRAALRCARACPAMIAPPRIVP